MEQLRDSDSFKRMQVQDSVKPAFSGDGGITPANALAAATDRAVGERVDSYFEDRLATIRAADGGNSSNEMLTARAALDTVHEFGGASPHVGAAYQQAMGGLSEGEQKYLSEYGKKAHNADLGGGIGDIRPAVVVGGLNPHGMQDQAASPNVSRESGE